MCGVGCGPEDFNSNDPALFRNYRIGVAVPGPLQDLTMPRGVAGTGEGIRQIETHSISGVNKTAWNTLCCMFEPHPNLKLTRQAANMIPNANALVSAFWVPLWGNWGHSFRGNTRVCKLSLGSTDILCDTLGWVLLRNYILLVFETLWEVSK